MAEQRFASAIASVAGALAGARDEWWIIGSAAVALHLLRDDLGGDPGAVADIDVLMSRRDLETLYQRITLTNTPDEGKAIFRSQRFGLWCEPALPVEFMAGLEVLRGGQWLAVEPLTRETLQLGNVQVFLPERAELIAILEQFGRAKDLQRAASLRNI